MTGKGLLPKYMDADINVVHSDLPDILGKILDKHKTISAKRFYTDRLNFLIASKNRVGKTWVLHSLANYLMKTFKEKSLYYVTAERLQQCFTEWSDPYDVNSTIHILEGARILFIDNVGLEYHKKDSDFGNAKFEEFLRYRFGNNKITYIGSKKWLSDFSNFYSDSLYDFILGEYVVINVETEESFNIGRTIRNTKLRG